MSNQPFITDVLELYAQTPEGLPLWKTKGMQLGYENVLENVFVLSSDLAAYFGARHRDLISKNLGKLRKEGYLNHERKISLMVEIGSGTQRAQTVFALTRHEVEYLVMDFSGPKARKKKLAILKRFHGIEGDILKGAYEEAREKASRWDGIQLLQQLGFRCSVPNQIATKHDIAEFLKIPESTLNNFLRKYSNEIKPIRLDSETIQSIGSKARYMNGYHINDVLKISYGMDTETGMELKKKMLGQIGIEANLQTKDEIQWRKVLSQIFKGLGLHYNFPIGKYRTDFFVESMLLCLECNGYGHRYYDAEKEKERESLITRRYALIRFHHNISLETLVNGILHAKPGLILRLDLED